MKKRYIVLFVAMLVLFSCSNENELVNPLENLDEALTTSSGEELDSSSGEISNDQLSKELTDDLNEILNLVPNE